MLEVTREWDIDYDEQSGHYEAEYADSPVFTYHGRVAGEYGVTAKWMEFSSAVLEDEIQYNDDTFSALMPDTALPFPSPSQQHPLYVTIGEEAMLVGGLSTQSVDDSMVRVTFTDVARGRLGTTAAGHSDGVGVFEGTEQGKAWILHSQLQTHDWGVTVKLPGPHWAVIASSSLNADDDFPDKDVPGVVGGRTFEAISVVSPDSPERLSVPGTSTREEMAEDAWLASLRSTTLVPSTYDNGLVVCDPMAEDPDQGDNVPFSESWSFSEGKDVGHILRILVVELP